MSLERFLRNELGTAFCYPHFVPHSEASLKAEEQFNNDKTLQSMGYRQIIGSSLIDEENANLFAGLKIFTTFFHIPPLFSKLSGGVIVISDDCKILHDPIS